MKTQVEFYYNLRVSFTDHGALIMYQHSQVFEDLVHLTNLLLDLLYPLLSFLDYSFIKYNLIVQQYKFLSANKPIKT